MSLLVLIFSDLVGKGMLLVSTLARLQDNSS